MPDNLLAAIRSWGLGEPLPDIGAAAAQSYSHRRRALVCALCRAVLP